MSSLQISNSRPKGAYPIPIIVVSAPDSPVKVSQDIIAAANLPPPNPIKAWIKNSLISHFAPRVIGSLKRSIEQNNRMIRERLIDPENYETCEEIIVDYISSYVANTLDLSTRDLIDKTFIQGMLLRVFAGSLPSDDNAKINAEELITNGIIDLLSSIQDLHLELVKLLNFIDRSKEERYDVKKVIRRNIEKFLMRYFPEKEKEFGSWFDSTILIRGRVWDGILNELTAGYYKFYRELYPLDRKKSEVSPYISNSDTKYKIKSFNNTFSEYILSFIKNCFHDSKNIEDLLQELKPVVNCEKFRSEHPPFIINLVKNIFSSKDPKVGQVFNVCLSSFAEFFAEVVNKHFLKFQNLKPPLPLLPKDLLKLEKFPTPPALLAVHFSNALETIAGDIWELFDSIHSNYTIDKENFLIRKATLEFLRKRFPDGINEFPKIFRILLGGDSKGWVFIEDQCVNLVTKFYKPILDVSAIFEDYKQKLANRVHDEKNPENTNPIVDQAVAISQAFADLIFEGFIGSLTKTEKDEHGAVRLLNSDDEFNEIEKLLQKLKLLFTDVEVPQNHPTEILSGLKLFLLKNDRRTLGFKKVIKTFLGQMIFKAGVNAILAADEKNPVSKHLLAANGFRHIASLFVRREDLSVLYRHINEYEKLVVGPLSEAELVSREQERKDCIHSKRSDHPKLSNQLMDLLFPDLPVHIPLPPQLQLKVSSSIKTIFCLIILSIVLLNVITGFLNFQIIENILMGLLKKVHKLKKTWEKGYNLFQNYFRS